MSYLADYELLSWIGPGNSGDWWLARPPERLPIVADHVGIKALWRDGTELDFDRMARELRILSTIDSPHLAQLLEAGESDGRLFYVRRHYEGGSLATSNLSTAATVAALADAADGAQALHDNAVLHRDIKPDNVLIGDDGAVLAELGLAQLLDQALTTGIGPVGSIEYVSPEVALGDKGTPASDVWSLAVTAHQTLTGESIYGSEPPTSVLEGFRRVTSGRFALHHDLQPDIRAVLDNCLQHEPANRLNSAGAMAAALRSINSLAPEGQLQ